MGVPKPERPRPGALPSGASLHSWVGEAFVPIFFFFKNQQKRDPEKRPSLREKELLCSLKLPSLELVGGAEDTPTAISGPVSLVTLIFLLDLSNGSSSPLLNSITQSQKHL